jgi:hypothetical protein
MRDVLTRLRQRFIRLIDAPPLPVSDSVVLDAGWRLVVDQNTRARPCVTRARGLAFARAKVPAWFNRCDGEAGGCRVLARGRA